MKTTRNQQILQTYYEAALTGDSTNPIRSIALYMDMDGLTIVPKNESDLKTCSLPELVGELHRRVK